MPYDQPDPCVELVRGADYASEEAERAANMVKQRELAQRKGKREADKEEGALRRGYTKSLLDYEMASKQWLWHHRIPVGDLTLLAGRAQIGKSTTLCTMAAWITRGTMRGVYLGSPQNVIYIPNEDSVETTVKPRLLAVPFEDGSKGADLSRISTFHVTYSAEEDEDCALVLPEDCERLAQQARAENVVAIFIDPLSSNMGDRDRNKPEVRGSYERLRRMAEINKLSIIGNAHLAKRQTDNLLDGILGSSEIGNIARAAIGIIQDPESEDRQFILSTCKANDAPYPQTSYVYRIKATRLWDNSVGWVDTSFVEWQPSTDRQVNDLMADNMVNGGGPSSVKECTEWLQEYMLANGRCSRSEVLKQAQKEKFQEHTVQRAAKKLKIQFSRQGFPSVSMWSLPVQSPQS